MVAFEFSSMLDVNIDDEYIETKKRARPRFARTTRFSASISALQYKEIGIYIIINGSKKAISKVLRGAQIRNFGKRKTLFSK